MAQKLLSIFCAKCQKKTLQTAAADLNGEQLYTCQECGGFIKLPAGTKMSDAVQHFQDHFEANEGQVSIAETEATINALLDEYGVDEPVTPADAPQAQEQPVVDQPTQQ